MSKKDKKIEIQLKDEKVVVDNNTIDGVALVNGKKVIGEIVEINGSFASVKDGSIEVMYKSMDEAVQALIENFNLNN